MIETIVVQGVNIRIEGLREHEGHTITRRFTEHRTVDGVRTPVVFNESVSIRSEYMDIIIRTLELVPVSHLTTVVAHNIIKIRQTLRVGGGSGQAGYIYLSPFSLDNPYNRVHNQTLLHEIGHKVNTHYHSVDNMSAVHIALMNHIRHEGGTQGAAEAYADCYMDYFHRGEAAFRGSFSLQASGVSFRAGRQRVSYTSTQINEERLAAFLSVAPMAGV